jgi:D-alanyl-D-alanine carboxypeptidase/D-alanyl-D-alanine-endopeptidase (penicillin-binding protein 4)
MKIRISKRYVSFIIFHSTFIIILSSCSIQKQISKSAQEDVLSNKALTTAHVGISIFEPAANKYWFNYQGDKYFVPASNTKLPTCYAAMKYLGDSLVGLRYKIFDQGESPIILVKETGDPTFLHPDFNRQPVYDFFKKQKIPILLLHPEFQEKALGSGWAWNDYDEYYMTERSPMPIYGNVVRIVVRNNKITVTPKYFLTDSINDDLNEFVKEYPYDSFTITRDRDRNRYDWKRAGSKFSSQEIPFVTDESTVRKLLYDTLGVKTTIRFARSVLNDLSLKIHSQPTDSLLKPMMHRSDNFFAEQSLLMVSNERLGVMNDEKIIDTLLKIDFKDLPQKPKWVDGSGLSRYNLFTPQDFVAILNKMKNEFGMERVKVILPTGGEGTISSYYKADSGYQKREAAYFFYIGKQSSGISNGSEKGDGEVFRRDPQQLLIGPQRRKVAKRDILLAS